MGKGEKGWKGWERWEKVENRWKRWEKLGKGGKKVGKSGKGEKRWKRWGKGGKGGTCGLYFAFIHSSARESAKCCQHQMRSNLCQQLIKKERCFIDSKMIRNVLQYQLPKKSPGLLFWKLPKKLLKVFKARGCVCVCVSVHLNLICFNFSDIAVPLRGCCKN